MATIRMTEGHVHAVESTDRLGDGSVVEHCACGCRRHAVGEERGPWAAVLLRVAAQNEPCGSPVPSIRGTGECQRCGWQHAPRGLGAVERRVLGRG